MEKYGVNELRKMFLDYFEENGHLKMKSFSLIPKNDNSLLIINSGMAPLKPYFTGQEIPPRRRVTTCQKCIRTGDIENIGHTQRHGTFFEMLGNFSFGDYFKKEAIHFSWEFLTKKVGLDPNRLYPSVYEEDDEAYEIWHNQEGIPYDRIFKFGKADNFWEHGSGPCGPCSEIYYDRGEKYGCGKPTCTVGCDCDRYMEVWNNVFSQFNNDGKGNYTELIQKNIDTGMGLERLAVVCQDVDSIFDVDTLAALTSHVGEMTGVRYKTDPKADVSIRIITDHIRSVTFMISDGIMPGNVGRGYVLRRLLRRAARHGRMLGVKGTFLASLAKTVIDTSKDGYPELKEKESMILSVITEEENKFNKTIDQGLSILNDEMEEAKKNKETVLSGDKVFRLYDTYGFPKDLTAEILQENGLSYREEEFEKAMQLQKETARSSRKKSNYMGKDASAYDDLDASLTTEFTGYDHMEDTGNVTALIQKSDDPNDYGAIVDTLEEGDMGAVITDKTPFYGTMGGQESDIGTISSSLGIFEVKEAIHLNGNKIAHVGVVTSGTINLKDAVTLTVNPENRENTCENHSATHLLQKALREVLGTHVEQAGSLNNATRLRFDFNHFQAMTEEEKEAVEKIVNDSIKKALPVVTRIMNIEDAKKEGAMALFGEKYTENVRMVSMGDFSKELCGGTHVKNTADIKLFKILSESGVSAGVRRIEAITGDRVMEYYQNLEKEFVRVAAILKSVPSTLEPRIHSLLEETKSLREENDKLKATLSNNAASDLTGKIQKVGDVSVLVTDIENKNAEELRSLVDSLKDQCNEYYFVFASSVDGKVNLLAAASEKTSKVLPAGNLIKEISPMVGGGGGGRPTLAQAGGKNPTGIPEALKRAEEILSEKLH